MNSTYGKGENATVDEKQKRQPEIEKFYASRLWRRNREAYAKSKQNLCERCLAKGLIIPGAEVHHKKRLTAENIHDAAVALNWDNLELLCEECHKEEHGKMRPRTDPDGHVEL